MTSQDSVAGATTAPDTRLDRWLWTARFFKTRSLAAQAIDGGKVHLNGMRVKRSKMVAIGDEVRLTKPPFEYTVVITGVARHRGSATDAQALYRESAESKAARERLRLQLRYQPTATYEGKGRPTKKERRQIDRFKQGR